MHRRSLAYFKGGLQQAIAFVICLQLLVTQLFYSDATIVPPRTRHWLQSSHARLSNALSGSSIRGLRLSWPLLTRLSAVCFYQHRPQQAVRPAHNIFTAFLIVFVNSLNLLAIANEQQNGNLDNDGDPSI